MAIVHVMDGECADHGVERLVGERQWFTQHVLLDHATAAQPGVGQLDHRTARVERHHLGAALHQRCRIEPGATTRVQDVQPVHVAEQVEQRRAVVVGVERAVCRVLLEHRGHRVVDVPEMIVHHRSVGIGGTGGI